LSVTEASILLVVSKEKQGNMKAFFFQTFLLVIFTSPSFESQIEGLTNGFKLVSYDSSSSFLRIVCTATGLPENVEFINTLNIVLTIPSEPRLSVALLSRSKSLS